MPNVHNKLQLPPQLPLLYYSFVCVCAANAAYPDNADILNTPPTLHGVSFPWGSKLGLGINGALFKLLYRERIQ